MIVNAIVTLDGKSTLSTVTEHVQWLESVGVTAVTIEGLAESPMGAAFTGEYPPASAYESTTLCGFLARKTSTIGLVAANTALYGFPYHLARRLATLDHLTHGRAGWALRTSTIRRDRESFDWRSTGTADERSRAAEYIEVALELWDSWEPGAAVPNKATGDFKDDSRISAIDYVSDNFRVRGPLDVPRSPQGRPMIFAELADPADAALVAEFADVVALGAQTVEHTTRLAVALSDAVDATGRGAAVRVLPVVSVDTMAESFALGRDSSAAIAQTMEIVDAAGADGLTVRLDGTDEDAYWLVNELIPYLTADTKSAHGPLLSDRLRLSDHIQHGRRAA